MIIERYTEAFHRLRLGVTQIIVHATDPSSTFQYISNSGPTRRGDLLAMVSPELREAAGREGLILTTWRELQQRRDRVGAGQ